MEDRIVYEIYDGYYVPDGFFDPGYFVENEIVAWSKNEQVAEKYAEGLRQDGDCGYEIFENDYNPEYHKQEEFIEDESGGE